MSDTKHMPAPHRREGGRVRSALGSKTAQRWAGGFFLAALLFFTGAVVWAATVAGNQPKQARAAEVEPSMLTMPRKPVTKIVSTNRATRPAARKTLAPTPQGIRTRIKVPKRPVVPQRFANCTELRKVHPGGVPLGHPAYELRHDRDRDNWACEISGGPIKTSGSPSPSPARTTTRPATSPSPEATESESPHPPVVPPIAGN